MLLIGEGLLHFRGQGVGHTLKQQGLLPFQEELLVAQRAHRQPGEHQAGHEHREHEDQRNLFHVIGLAAGRSSGAPRFSRSNLPVLSHDSHSFVFDRISAFSSPGAVPLSSFGGEGQGEEVVVLTQPARYVGAATR